MARLMGHFYGEKSSPSEALKIPPGVGPSIPKYVILIANPLYRTSPDPLEWGLCGRGLHQSPINLNSGSATLQPSNSFTFDYQTLHNVPLVSTHHTIQAQADQINTINTLTFDNGKVYDLAQFHFHSPGEHQLDGEFFPMEVHFVHTSKGW